MTSKRTRRTRNLNLILTGPAWEWLCEMFSANVESPFFMKKFLTFQHAAALGFKPWHESLAILWKNKGVSLKAKPDRADVEAWELLVAYHEEYRRSHGN